MPTNLTQDRIHLAPNGLCLSDSDLAMLSGALGTPVLWPQLRGTPDPRVLHVATIRTLTFGARPGGDMIAELARYDAARRAHDGSSPFGAEFIETCRLRQRRAAVRDKPATRREDLGADVLRMWLADD